MNARSVPFVLFALMSLFATSAVQAQLPPSSQPLMIDRPGVYVLNRDIRVANGDAITIRSSGVTLDLNGRSVTTASPSTAPFASRGIFVDGMSARRKGVTIKNGKVSRFSVNVAAMNVDSLVVTDLQITGEGSAPAGGPTEIGMMLINARSSKIKHNTISSVNLGLFVRGGGSTGNTLSDNTLTGGETAGNNLLGICYNPAPDANPQTDGPTGDLISNNHITRFGFAVALSAASRWNVFRGNTLISFSGAFRETQRLVANGGTNVEEANITVLIPAP